MSHTCRRATVSDVFAAYNDHMHEAKYPVCHTAQVAFQNINGLDAWARVRHSGHQDDRGHLIGQPYDDLFAAVMASDTSLPASR